MGKCKLCGQEIEAKTWYVGDCINTSLGAILLDRKPAYQIGSIVLAMIPPQRSFFVWYLDAEDNLQNGTHFLSLSEAYFDFKRRR